MSTIAVYAGSFDPITLGHLSVIDQATLAFDQVVVAVGVNSAKNPIFPQDERQGLIREATKDYEKIRVVSFQGLLADYCASLKSDTKKVVIVRGLRAVSDFESEMAVGHVNQNIQSTIPTVFFQTAAHLSYVSSSAARELARHQESPGAMNALSAVVPPCVIDPLLEKTRCGL